MDERTEEVSVGSLATVNCDGLQYSPEGFALGYYEATKFMLAESIELDTFPSYNDFRGRKVLVDHGELVLVTKLVGRPDQISAGDRWCAYDVFEVVVRGQKCQMFRQNLSGCYLRSFISGDLDV